jgi:hypothetical protein
MNTENKINLVIAIATCLSVVASLAVAYLTWNIAKSNRITAELLKLQIEVASRPYIQIGPSIREGAPLLQLEITNAGQSNAQELRLELDQDFYFNAEQSEDRNLRGYSAFTHEIATFSPRSTLIFNLGTGLRVINNPNKCPHQFTVKATYKHNGKDYCESTIIDLQPFRSVTLPINAVAEKIENLTQVIQKIGDHFVKS